MIKLSFREPTTAGWKAWRRECKRKTDSDIRSYRPGNRVTIDEKLYKKQKPFLTGVTGPFHGKCAFCETSITNQAGDIEHYRPKGKVQDAQGKTIQLTSGRRKYNHPGYFWLAYYWPNLLPSCEQCNRFSGGFGKGNRFPIEGHYATAPGEEASEQPLLIHPVFDDPEDHIEFDRKCILVGKTKKGQTTIEILGLNERSLPRDRKRKQEEIELKFCKSISMLSEVTPSVVKRQIKELESDDQTFVAVARKTVSRLRRNARAATRS